MDNVIKYHGKTSSRVSLFSRHVKDMTLALGLLQIIYSLLAFIDRLNPTIASSYYVVDLLIDDSFWSGAFLLSGSFVVASMQYKLLREVSMAFSAGTLLVWGMLCFLKSLSAVQPVAWSVGLSAIALGIIAYKLCVTWNTLSLEPVVLTTPA